MNTRQQESMPREAIEEEIKGYKWYQTIPLGNGICTPGKGGYTGAKVKLLELPDDLSGKSVLDIGCREGFFAFEAEKRGASCVMAIDVNRRAHKKFKLVKKILNSNVEFKFLSVFDLDERVTGRFDLVVFLSVLHRLKYPFLALDKIASITSELAVMEVPVAALASATGSVDDDPMMIRTIDKRGHYLLYPNVPFLVEMLGRAGFARVEIVGVHRRRRIEGYENKYVENRVILKAFIQA